jgi:octaprenyl-diphosphate synthase
MRATISATASDLARHPCAQPWRCGEEKSFWHNAMLGHRVSADDLAYATSLLRRHNAIDDTLERARHYGQRAIDALGPFPASAAKDALVEAVEFAIARAY